MRLTVREERIKELSPLFSSYIAIIFSTFLGLSILCSVMVVDYICHGHGSFLSWPSIAAAIFSLICLFVPAKIFFYYYKIHF